MMLSPLTVVVPKPVLDIYNAEVLVVANDVADDVDIYSEPPAFLNVNPVLTPSVSANCGAVDEARVNRYCGVVVPNPVQLFSEYELSIDDVAINDPIVKLFDEVEISCVPAPLTVMIVFGVNAVLPVPPESVLSACARVSAPVDEKLDVADPPKYALKAETSVVEAKPVTLKFPRRRVLP